MIISLTYPDAVSLANELSFSVHEDLAADVQAAVDSLLHAAGDSVAQARVYLREEDGIDVRQAVECANFWEIDREVMSA